MSHLPPILITVLVCSAIAYGILSRIRAAHRREKEVWERQQNDALERARQERDGLLNALTDAFLLIGPDTEILFVNEKAHQLFSGRQIVGRTVRETFLDGRLADALLHGLETGEPVHSHIVLPQQASPLGDHETRGVNAWVIDAARLPDSPANRPITRVVIRDVTPEHQLEQVRKDFVANASHELRTPLAIITGYLENLLDDDMLEDPNMTRRFLTIMRKHSDRISRIVEDMLVISRLESGEASTLKLEPFKFRSCIHDILERLESLISQQHAEVRIVMPDESLQLNADRFYWTQVLFNLVENALKQNQRSGLKIEIGCIQKPEGGVSIWVADNGVGIPSADLAHIFRRFYRVEKHHSQQEIKGTGLGLSIVKRAVEAHGGTIRVTSTPGQETRFTIELPASILA